MAGPAYHGRTHLPGGTDPIPGFTLGSGNPVFGSYDELILSTSGLVGYWPLDEASGDALDHSGNGYHFDDADFSGTPTQGEPGPFANPADPTSYEFGGANYIERVTPTMATGAGSIEFWLNVSAYPVGATLARIIDIQSGSNQLGVQVRGTLAANTGEMSLDMQAAGQVFSGVDLNLDEWVHYVGVGSASDAMKIYWNAELIATGSTVASFGLAGAQFKIGQLDGLNMAQVALYDVVLTPEQISSHYQSGISDPYAENQTVFTADGAGDTSWEFPTIEVTY